MLQINKLYSFPHLPTSTATTTIYPVVFFSLTPFLLHTPHLNSACRFVPIDRFILMKLIEGLSSCLQTALAHVDVDVDWIGKVPIISLLFPILLTRKNPPSHRAHTHSYTNHNHHHHHNILVYPIPSHHSSSLPSLCFIEGNNLAIQSSLLFVQTRDSNPIRLNTIQFNIEVLSLFNYRHTISPCIINLPLQINKSLKYFAVCEVLTNTR